MSSFLGKHLSNPDIDNYFIGKSSEEVLMFVSQSGAVAFKCLLAGCEKRILLIAACEVARMCRVVHILQEICKCIYLRRLPSRIPQRH